MELPVHGWIPVYDSVWSCRLTRLTIHPGCFVILEWRSCRKLHKKQDESSKPTRTFLEEGGTCCLDHCRISWWSIKLTVIWQDKNLWIFRYSRVGSFRRKMRQMIDIPQIQDKNWDQVWNTASDINHRMIVNYRSPPSFWASWLHYRVLSRGR